MWCAHVCVCGVHMCVCGVSMLCAYVVCGVYMWCVYVVTSRCTPDVLITYPIAVQVFLSGIVNQDESWDEQCWAQELCHLSIFLVCAHILHSTRWWLSP